MARQGDGPVSEIVWRGPLFQPSGYGEAARAFVLGLMALGLPVAARSLGPFLPGFRRQLDPAAREALDALTARTAGPDHVGVVHFPAQLFARRPGAAVNVGRTMFETDGLPADWVARCNLMDEVWVPTAFNLETFSRAGVRAPLRKVPEGVDPERFSPHVIPLPVAGARRVFFLSVFEWNRRKGWDILLRAWARAFHRDDDVSLVLRARPIDDLASDATAGIASRVEDFLERELGTTRERLAPIIVLGGPLSDAEVPRLIAAASALVAPSHGEGWGRPHLEAMACARPVIATRWSGNLEFMDDSNSLLVDVEAMETVDSRQEVPYHWGQRWAVPSTEHLVELLRTIARDPEVGAALGRKARADAVERWSWERACRIAAERLAELADARARRAPPRARPRVVVWSGAGDAVFALAKIDHEVTGRLARDGRLALIPSTDAPASLRADVRVDHTWPPPTWPPPDGRWVVMAHWDLGALPRAWVDAWRDRVDEVWVSSGHVRDFCVRSGLPPERVVVVPCGVDPRRFRPDVEPLPLSTHKRFRFLYVGTGAWRKGLDLLITTYLREFRAADDVCLVARVHGHAPEDQAARDSIRRCQAVPGAPEIELLDRTLPEDEMPRLYAACDCLVHPYRAEGFAIPLAEAMACGLPLIATGHGPALEICDPEITAFVPAVEASRDEHRVDDWETVGAPRCAEPDPHALRRLMRRAVDEGEPSKSRARRAAERARARFDWDRSAHVVADRILRLADRPIRRLAPSRSTAPGSGPAREPVDHALRWGETVLRLRTPGAELARRVADLAGLGCEPIGGERPAHVDVSEADPGFVVAATGRSLWCATADDLVLALVTALSDGLAALAEEPVLVHAGAIVAGGRAAIYVGPERAGKSWLTFAAWLDGLTVVGDDVLALDPGRRAVSAFPRPVKLRVTEPALPPALAARRADRAVALGRVDGEWRVAIGRGLPGMAPLSASYPASRLFFLSRCDSGPSALGALGDPREAAALLTEATAIGGSPPGLRVVSLLKALWDAGRVERLTLGLHDARGALALLTERLASGG